MPHVAFELVDAGVVPAREGALSTPSPGVALLDPAGGVTVGEEAASQARLKPVLAFDRFWSELSTDPLPRPAAGAGSRADLAYLHLSALWRMLAQPGDEALFALPGTMRPAEAGLLAGVARAAAVPVTGFVDLAVAACASLEAHETVLHLDLQFHQAVLTELRGDPLRRRRVEVAPRVGLKALYAAWAQLVAESMVRRTRFDPLHQAATEQQLFDRLPGWLSSLAGQEAVDAELEGGAGRFGVSLRREQFVFAAEAFYTQLADLIQGARRAGEPVTIALSARAALLPALAERCRALADAEVVTLPEGAAALGALRWADDIAAAPDAELLELPRASAPRRTDTHGVRGASPTHVVFAGRAHRISGEALEIGLAGAGDRSLVVSGPAAGISRRHCSVLERDGAVWVTDHSRYGTFVNGEKVAGSAMLAAGDRLRVGTPGVVLELVSAG